MKKLILFYILTFVISQISFSQEYGWVDVSENIPGEPQNLSDIHFITLDTCWITSNSSPEVFYTTDSGQNYTSQDNEYGTNLQAMFMLSSTEGYVGGASGIIYRTTNSGDDWNYHGSIGTNLTDITFPAGSTTGYCCGNSGNIYQITSSGITPMTSNSVVTLSSITFPSTTEGWVCGENTIRHYTGGAWTADQVYTSGSYSSIYFIPGTTQGWCVGDRILHTTNGTSWASQANPDTQGRYMANVLFLNASEGWIVGTQGLILHTTDGGTSWTTHESNTEETLRKIFAINDDIYVVGNYGFFKKYGELSSIGSTIIETLKFEIFPNPTTNKFEFSSLEFSTKNCKIELYDLYGKRLIEKQIPIGSENIEIDVSNLASGVYFCTMKTDKKSSTKKLIIE